MDSGPPEQSLLPGNVENSISEEPHVAPKDNDLRNAESTRELGAKLGVQPSEHEHRGDEHGEGEATHGRSKHAERGHRKCYKCGGVGHIAAMCPSEHGSVGRSHAVECSKWFLWPARSPRSAGLPGTSNGQSIFPLAQCPLAFGLPISQPLLPQLFAQPLQSTLLAGGVADVGGGVRCFRCGGLGHISRNCPGSSTLCDICRLPGHIAKDCPFSTGMRFTSPHGQQPLVQPSIRSADLPAARPPTLPTAPLPSVAAAALASSLLPAAALLGAVGAPAGAPGSTQQAAAALLAALLGVPGTHAATAQPPSPSPPSLPSRDGSRARSRSRSQRRDERHGRVLHDHSTGSPQHAESPSSWHRRGSSSRDRGDATVKGDDADGRDRHHHRRQHNHHRHHASPSATSRSPHDVRARRSRHTSPQGDMALAAPPAGAPAPGDPAGAAAAVFQQVLVQQLLQQLRQAQPQPAAPPAEVPIPMADAAVPVSQQSEGMSSAATATSGTPLFQWATTLATLLQLQQASGTSGIDASTTGAAESVGITATATGASTPSLASPEEMPPPTLSVGERHGNTEPVMPPAAWGSLIGALTQGAATR